MGDMFFDQKLGNELSKLALMFKYFGRAEKKTIKRVLVGDPGRWFLEQKRKSEKASTSSSSINASSSSPSSSSLAALKHDVGENEDSEKGQVALNCIGKYDLGREMSEQHFGLVNGYIYELC